MRLQEVARKIASEYDYRMKNPRRKLLETVRLYCFENFTGRILAFAWVRSDGRYGEFYRVGAVGQDGDSFRVVGMSLNQYGGAAGTSVFENDLSYKEMLESLDKDFFNFSKLKQKLGNELFKHFKPQAEEIDWRPAETLPEDHML